MEETRRSFNKMFGKKGVETHHIVSVSRYFNRASRTSARVVSSFIASNALETIDV